MIFKRSAGIAVRDHYNAFYSEVVPLLEEIAYNFDGISWGSLGRCDDHTLYFDFTTFSTNRFLRLHINRFQPYGLHLQSYYKLDFLKKNSPEFRANMFKLFSGLLDHYQVRLYKFDLNGIDISDFPTKKFHLISFDLTGTILSNREDSRVAEHYVQGTSEEKESIRNLLRGLTDNIHNFITQFASRESLSTTINAMDNILALDRLSFVKMLLTSVGDRAVYFGKNINKEYVEEFNKLVQYWIITGVVPYEFDEDAWKKWYKDYIKDDLPITDAAVKDFMSFMVEDWEDDWFDHPEKYNFDSDGSLIYVSIEFQPWFSSDFLVLHKYFPNIQHID